MECRYEATGKVLNDRSLAVPEEEGGHDRIAYVASTNRDEIRVVPPGGPQEPHPHRLMEGELRCNQDDLLV